MFDGGFYIEPGFIAVRPSGNGFAFGGKGLQLTKRLPPQSVGRRMMGMT